MTTRLEVLLQRRKSAAAGPFHRHIAASASNGIKPAARRAENGWGRWESVAIIQRSYIKSLMISRKPAAAVNGQPGVLRQLRAQNPSVKSSLRSHIVKSLTKPT